MQFIITLDVPQNMPTHPTDYIAQVLREASAEVAVPVRVPPIRKVHGPDGRVRYEWRTIGKDEPRLILNPPKEAHR
jgi:hypothetical protein